VGRDLRRAAFDREAAMSELARYSNAFRNANPELQHQAWKLLDRHVDDLYSKIGKTPLTHVDGASALSTVPPPPAASFAVSGEDGKFKVAIVNPQNLQPLSPAILMAQARAGLNRQLTPILHNLESSPDLNFDNNSGVTDYGISSQLAYEFQDPNVTKFFRLRSSFDGQSWNAWQIYSSPLTCGPVGVQSGLLRTAALTQVNAAYTPTTQPLSSATGALANQATIAIAAFLVQYPMSISPGTNGLVPYNSGSIGPLLDSTHYYVYCLDPTYAGGAQTYIATTSNPEVNAHDSIVFLGTITTPAHGGGGTGGTGGGGGPCFSGNTLVITKDGMKPIVDVIGGYDEVLTQRGWRKVRALLEHAYDGPMQDMGNDEFVTPDHRFWIRRAWDRAAEIFLDVISRFTGAVFNLSIEGDGSDEEQCYTLANGWIVHNLNKL
jgi:hypothetical protein